MIAYKICTLSIAVTLAARRSSLSTVGIRAIFFFTGRDNLPQMFWQIGLSSGWLTLRRDGLLCRHKATQKQTTGTALHYLCRDQRFGLKVS